MLVNDDIAVTLQTDEYSSTTECARYVILVDYRVVVFAVDISKERICSSYYSINICCGLCILVVLHCYCHLSDKDTKFLIK